MKRTVAKIFSQVMGSYDVGLGFLLVVVILSQPASGQTGPNTNRPYWQQIPQVAANDPGWASASDESNPGLPPSTGRANPGLPPSSTQGLPNSSFPPSPIRYPTTPELPPVQRQYPPGPRVASEVGLPRSNQPPNVTESRDIPWSSRSQAPTRTEAPSRETAPPVPEEVAVPPEVGLPPSGSRKEPMQQWEEPKPTTEPSIPSKSIEARKPKQQREPEVPVSTIPPREEQESAPSAKPEPTRRPFFLPGSTRAFTGITELPERESTVAQPPVMEATTSQPVETPPQPTQTEALQQIVAEPPQAARQVDPPVGSEVTVGVEIPSVDDTQEKPAMVEDRYSQETFADKYQQDDTQTPEPAPQESAPVVVDDPGLDDYYRQRYAKEEPAPPAVEKPVQEAPPAMVVNAPQQQDYQFQPQQSFGNQPPGNFAAPPQTPTGNEPAPVARLRMEVGPGNQLPAQATLNTGPAELVSASVLARVGTEVILASEVIPPVEARLKQAKGKVPPSQLEKLREGLIKKQLQRIIERKILYIEAKRDIPEEAMADVRGQLDGAFEEYLTTIIAEGKLSGRAELQAVFEEQGITMANQKRQFQETTLARQWLRQNTKINETVTREELLEYYNEHKDDYKITAKARWQELMISFDKVPGEEQAFDTLAAMGNRVLDGEAFEVVAKRSSHGVTAAEGGYRDWTEKGALVCEELDNALFSLPAMTLSPIIRSRQGFHIVMVLERQEAGYTDFVETQPEIREIILEKRRKEVREEYLEKVRDNVQVWTIFDDPSQSLPKGQ